MTRLSLSPSRRLRVAAAFALCGLWLAYTADARAEACVFDPAAKAVTAEITPGSGATLKVVAGEIHFGFLLTSCGGATTTNTDSISIVGAAGSTERLVLDLAGGPFAPGVMPESNVPEIEVAVALGDASDRLVVLGTDTPDRLTASQNGVMLNIDGDVDVTLAPNPVELELHGLGDADFIAGRGFGPEYLGRLTIDGGDGDDTLTASSADDRVDGGSGADTIDGQAGDDLLDGGGGNDTVKGSLGNDSLTGGVGIDTLTGADGDDVLYAEDGLADAVLNGGPGNDTAYYDLSLDPAPVAVETRNGTPPPPPPAGSCIYNDITKSVSAQLAPGAAPHTLRIVAGAIHFGQETLAPCGAATTTNTDKITVVGTTELDRLVIDESGGWFVPGASPEADTTSEIEIAANLGEATDELTVIGADRNDNISIGQSGIALNADGDNDVTWSPRLNKVTVYGMGGRNMINGLGGAGSGSGYNGQLFLYAGDVGDTLRGGTGSDTLTGGAGNDLLDGRENADTLDGRGGNDSLIGAGGGDSLTGGPGSDTFSGGDGADVIYANDGESDGTINGGPLNDTAHYDAGLDLEIVAVENRIAS